MPSTQLPRCLAHPPGSLAARLPSAVETLLERWVVHYHPQLPEGPSHLSRSQLSRLNPSSVYKRLVITLRSLYTYVRLLPAYRMFRACKVSRGGPGLWHVWPVGSAAGARRKCSLPRRPPLPDHPP